MKRIFSIEWPDENGQMWMNKDNLLVCLMAYCPNTAFVVEDITDKRRKARISRVGRAFVVEDVTDE